MGQFADLQFLRSHINSPAGEIVHFINQHLRIHDHSVADITDFFLQYTGGNQMTDELLTVYHHGVTGIVPSLKPDHNIGNIREQIDNFPLTLIPPLGSNDYYVCHASLLWLMTP